MASSSAPPRSAAVAAVLLVLVLAAPGARAHSGVSHSDFCAYFDENRYECQFEAIETVVESGGTQRCDGFSRWSIERSVDNEPVLLDFSNATDATFVAHMRGNGVGVSQCVLQPDRTAACYDTMHASSAILRFGAGCETLSWVSGEFFTGSPDEDDHPFATRGACRLVSVAGNPVDDGDVELSPGDVEDAFGEQVEVVGGYDCTHYEVKRWITQFPWDSVPRLSGGSAGNGTGSLHVPERDEGAGTFIIREGTLFDGWACAHMPWAGDSDTTAMGANIFCVSSCESGLMWISAEDGGDTLRIVEAESLAVDESPDAWLTPRAPNARSSTGVCVREDEERRESREDRQERARKLLVDSAEGVCTVVGDFACSYVGLEYDAATGSSIDVSGTASFTLSDAGFEVPATGDGQGGSKVFNFQLNPTRPEAEDEYWITYQPTRRLCSFLPSSDASRGATSVCTMDQQAGWGEVHWKDCSTFEMVLGRPLLPTFSSSPTALRYECERI